MKDAQDKASKQISEAKAKVAKAKAKAENTKNETKKAAIIHKKDATKKIQEQEEDT